MTDAELLFTSLAELTTNKIAEKDKAVGFDKNAVSAKKAGHYTKKAKDNFEKVTETKVISDQNYLTSQTHLPKGPLPPLKKEV